MSLPHSLHGTLAFLSATLGANRGELETVRYINLPDYMGTWRVLACMDNPIEAKFCDAAETYSLARDGRTVGVTFEWRDGSLEAPRKVHRFRGTVADQTSNATWKMRLFPPFRATYLIIAVDPDYQWAAVAHPSRRFGWVLARERALPVATMEGIYDEFERRGFSTQQFIEVPQFPSPSPSSHPS